MKIYQVYVETSQEALDEGGPLAHVPELPGCTARAPTLDAVKDAIRQAAHDYIAFLRAQGERDLSDEFDLEFEETRSYTLPSDYAPMTLDEFARAKRWLELSRSGLLAELASASFWDAHPSEKDWSLRQIVNHIGTAELYLTDKLMEPVDAPLDRLHRTRRAALDRLEALPPQDLGRVTTCDGEDWTPRKVMRRMLEHEQEHLAQVRHWIESMLRAIYASQ